MGPQSSTDPERGRPRRRRFSSVIAEATWMVACLGTLGAAWGQNGSSLPLMLPSGVAFDGQGNLYVADAGGHVVREVSAAGTVTIVAGTGVQGFGGDGGPATAARLDSPAGVALDAAGDLFIADSHNHRVREVVAGTGVIRTIAGTGGAGFGGDGGAATSARLNLPTGLACDGSANLYVADTNNHRIRRIALASGVISRVAGTGTEGFSGDGGAAVSAAIDAPRGVAVDAAGNLYISDTHNARVRMVAATTGAITTVAGNGAAGFGGDGSAAAGARLSLPDGVAVDAAGNIYVGDRGNQRVRRISPSGTILTIAGNGTQGFAGDGAQATAAMLDSPRGVAASAAGAVAMADSGNERVRLLDTQTTPGPSIHTVPWLSSATPASVVASGPSSVTYGSGTITATVSGTGTLAGDVALVDATGGAPILVGNGRLGAGGAVSFSLAGLPAGAHTLFSAYAGDATHASAQSAPISLTVTPKAITATANSVSILYGQAVPALDGSVNGVLAQDAGKLSAQFFVTAGALSPVGTYPIQVNLNGSAAGNYTVNMTPGAVTIGQAPTFCILSSSTTSATGGNAVTFSAQAVGSTSGVPTGALTLLDGNAVVGTGTLSGGSWSYSLSSLTAGTHTLTATYSGDSNFLPSNSATVVVTVGGAPDFALANSGSASQTVAAGSAATFNFSIKMVGSGPASPIMLAVQGVPAGVTASLNPVSVPPGGAVTNFTLTIQTPLAKIAAPRIEYGGKGSATGGVLVSLLLVPFLRRGQTLARHMQARIRTGAKLALALAICILLGSFVCGCGDRVNGNSGGSHASTYTITVTGTATGPAGNAIQHSANVTLEVL